MTQGPASDPGGIGSSDRPVGARLPRRILLAAGGTGGHIYPALALGDELRLSDPDIELLYCCGNRPGELAIYEAAGVEPVGLPVSGRRRGVMNLLRFGREYLAARSAAGPIVNRFEPELAVGFGSYASLPALLAASRARCPIMLHEQNAEPGRANRHLARHARLVMLGLAGGEGRFGQTPTLVVGNPIRRELLRAIGKAEARSALGLPSGGRVVLCFGGSLGAAGLNRLALAAAQSSAAAGQWHWLWAAGPIHHESLSARIAGDDRLAGRVTLSAYLDRMDLAYAAADLVIARAGAITIAEITALGKPAVLIPLPRSAGDHQVRNAQSVAEAGGAVLVREDDPGAAEIITTTLAQLAAESDKLRGMSQAARGLGHPEAATRMVAALAEIHAAVRSSPP